jgi:hypothetical protein
LKDFVLDGLAKSAIHRARTPLSRCRLFYGSGTSRLNDRQLAAFERGGHSRCGIVGDHLKTAIGRAAAAEIRPRSIRPSSPYAASKAAFDLYLVSVNRFLKFPMNLIRPSNAYFRDSCCTG